MSVFSAPLGAAPGFSYIPDGLKEMGWYAVHTRSNFERRAAGELILKGIEVYLPTFREVHRWKDRYKAIDLPLFPGYVFVRFARSAATQLKVLQTPGIVRILGSGNAIERIPEIEIESIQRLLSANVPHFPHPFLCEGTWVRIKRGALEGLQGYIVRVKNKVRLVLSVNLLSRSVATELDACDVEVIRQERNAASACMPRV